MFDGCLYFNASALARMLDREWTRAFRPLGLTPAQAFMLRAILARPGLLQGELAAGLSISRPTATRTLDGLARLGLAERAATGRDGRESAIRPTPRAVALRTRLSAAGAEATRRMKQRLGDARFGELVAGLRDVRTLLAPPGAIG